jgi:hypothetical protein
MMKPLAIVSDKQVAVTLKKIVGSRARIRISSKLPSWKKKLLLSLSSCPVTGKEDKNYHQGSIVVNWVDREDNKREITYGNEDRAIIRFTPFNESVYKVSAYGDIVPIRDVGESSWIAIAFALALGFHLVEISQVFTDNLN